MQIRFGQRQEFAKSAGVLHNAEHRAARAVAAETARAPLAVAAGEIDLAHHALAEERGRVRLHHFAHKLVSGHAAEAVVAALEFEVGVADACQQKTDQREPFGAFRTRRGANGHDAVVEVHGSHCFHCSI